MSAGSAGPGVVDTAAAVRAGTTTALVAVTGALARIAAGDSALNSVTDTYAERAYEQAAAVDAAVAAGRDPGPLAGVPFVVKNLFDVAGSRTRAGSIIELDAPPAVVDATAVRRLGEAGAVVVAATNMDEYAHGFTTENAHDGTTRNPHDRTRIAGGSSGGAAAAVAGGFVPLAMGSDTNGSVRVPASLCGVFGLKPTYGRLSRAGSVLFVTSLDHVGPMARSTVDLAAAYDVLAAHDPADPVSTDHPFQSCSDSVGAGTQGLRLAVATGFLAAVPDEGVRRVVERAARALDVDREVQVGGCDLAGAAASVITSAEAGQRHLPRLRSRAADYDPGVRVGLMAGALVPAADYLAAQRFRAAFRESAHQVFDDLDVLVMATTPCAAPRIGQRSMDVLGEELLVGMSLGLLTQPWSLIGWPALTVPGGDVGGLPVGVQLVAPPHQERSLFRVAAVLEAFFAARPPEVPR